MLVRAEVLQKDGSLQEALQAIERGLADVDVMGEYWFEAELLRRKGELLLAILPRNEQEAAMLFAQAATLAMGQGATSLELRARTSLFRLTRSASSRAELQRVLQNLPRGWTRLISRMRDMCLMRFFSPEVLFSCSDLRIRTDHSGLMYLQAPSHQ
jgi:predicted ATPase